MQKFFINIIAVFFLFLLAGCQSNRSNPNLFSPFPFASSANLAQTVQDALLRSEDPVIARVQVQTRQDVVVLTGYVKKIRQSDIAEQIARQVPGVQSVENNIIIRQ